MTPKPLLALLLFCLHAHAQATLPPLPHDDRTFTKVEQPAVYPGGDSAWTNALGKLFSRNARALGHAQGECQLQFIVHNDGTVADVQALTMTDSKLAEVLIRFIKKGTRWTPPVRGGKAVVVYHKVSVTYPE